MSEIYEKEVNGYEDLRRQLGKHKGDKHGTQCLICKHRGKERCDDCERPEGATTPSLWEEIEEGI